MHLLRLFTIHCISQIRYNIGATSLASLGALTQLLFLLFMLWELNLYDFLLNSILVMLSQTILVPVNLDLPLIALPAGPASRRMRLSILRRVLELISGRTIRS